MKMNKRTKVIKYANENPDATVKEVSLKTGVSHPYVYKILREDVNTLVAETSIIPPHTTSDGSTASYYELPNNAKELQDLISHKNMNAQIGEIFRACYRYGEVSHSDTLRDAKKIKFYAEAEIKRLEKLL